MVSCIFSLKPIHWWWWWWTRWTPCLPLHRPAQDRDEPGRAWDSMMDSPKAPWKPQSDPPMVSGTTIKIAKTWNGSWNYMELLHSKLRFSQNAHECTIGIHRMDLVSIHSSCFGPISHENFNSLQGISKAYRWSLRNAETKRSIEASNRELGSWSIWKEGILHDIAILIRFLYKNFLLFKPQWEPNHW